MTFSDEKWKRPSSWFNRGRWWINYEPMMAGQIIYISNLKIKKTLKRINELIKDIERNGVLNGIGKPEALKYRKGFSRRIGETNRLVYAIDENGVL